MQSVHLPLLRQLAVAVGIAEGARAELAEGELVVHGSRGAILNPAFRAWSQAVALVARLAVESVGARRRSPISGCPTQRQEPPTGTRREVSEGDLMAEALDVGGLVRVDPVRFIQGELRHTSDRWAGRPFRLRAFQREFLTELFRETRARVKTQGALDGSLARRVYTRALWGLPQKMERAKSPPLSAARCSSPMGPTAPRSSPSRATGRGAHRLRLGETDGRVLASSLGGTPHLPRCDRGPRHGLRLARHVRRRAVETRPASERRDLRRGPRPAVARVVGRARVRVRRTHRTAAARHHHGGLRPPSLLGDLVREGEEGKDPRFLYRWTGLPQDSEADYRSPKTWKAANPALSCADPFLVKARLVDMARRLPENQFRRLHLNQWTTGRDVAFADGVWEAATSRADTARDRSEVVVAFVAARARDTVAIVGCTLDDPHVFVHRVWEDAERVDPSDVAEELRSVWSRYNVAEFLCSEHDWSWLLLMLAEEGLPITKVPRSPQRLALQWSQLTRRRPRAATVPRRRPRARAARLEPVADLGAVGTATRPGCGRRSPVAAALAAMLAYDGAARVEPAGDLGMILPTSVG